MTRYLLLYLFDQSKNTQHCNYVENYVENAAALVRAHVEGRVFEFRSQHISGSDIAERYATDVYVTGPRSDLNGFPVSKKLQICSLSPATATCPY